jgi:hypothetical protein
VEQGVRDEIRKTAVARRTEVTVRELPAMGRLKPAERGLLWALMHQPAEAARALRELEPEDLLDLDSAPILKAALALRETPPERLPTALLARLSEEEVRWLTRVGTEATEPAPVTECVRTLRQMRYERERAMVQDELERLQAEGSAADPEIDHLLRRKFELIERIAALGVSRT